MKMKSTTMMDLRVSCIKEAKAEEASSERSTSTNGSTDKTKTTKTAMVMELPQADADDASVSTSSSSSSTVTATSASTTSSSSQAQSELSARQDDLDDRDVHTSECNGKSAARHDDDAHEDSDEETVCSSSSSSSLSISSASVSSSPSCASADDEAEDVGGRHHHMHDFQKRHPSVSFNPQVRVRKIFIEDDCIVVPQEIWYDDIDYAAIKQESKDTIKIYKAGRLSDDDEDYCFRGLESRTKKGAKKRKELREKYRVTVLLEHMRQRYQRSIDEEELAIIACDLSLENQFEAYRRAVQDEQDVMASIYNSDDSDSSSSSDDDDESVL